MALLRCDKCGGSTNHFGSWDTPIRILCEECSKDLIKQIEEDYVNYNPDLNSSLNYLTPDAPSDLEI